MSPNTDKTPETISPNTNEFKKYKPKYYELRSPKTGAPPRRCASLFSFLTGKILSPVCILVSFLETDFTYFYLFYLPQMLASISFQEAIVNSYTWCIPSKSFVSAHISLTSFSICVMSYFFYLLDDFAHVPTAPQQHCFLLSGAPFRVRLTIKTLFRIPSPVKKVSLQLLS